jgi:hypothetical protein
VVVFMPRVKGRTTIEVSVGVRDRLSKLAGRLGVTYDRLIGELLNIAEYFADCTAEVGSSGLIYLTHGGETVVLTQRGYRILKKLIKFMPEPE